MTVKGAQRCAYFDASHTFDEYLAATYYDAENVFYKIGAYTGDSSWNNCAQKAEAVYRDQYAGSSGAVPGYWSFTHGLAQDFLETGDLESQRVVNLIAENAAYHANYTPVLASASFLLSRENAYAIMAYLNQERVGSPRRARLSGLVDNAFGHISQWFGSHPSGWYVKPFMVGLTARALIEYEAVTDDPRVLPAIQTAADGLWALWLPTEEAFPYIDRIVPGEGGPDPAPDLNLLIAPMYAWLWKKTGNLQYLQRGDQIFAGGVKNAYLEQNKQFNQNYTWSFDYVKWRSE